MALPEDVYGSLVQLREALDKEGLPVAELPDFHQPTRLFSFWFAHTFFLLVEHFYERQELPRVETPERITSAIDVVARRVNERMKVPLPPMKRRGPFAVMASWLQTAGRAIGGSNWCIHDAAGTRTPMDIFRYYDVPGEHELQMLCRDGLHRTEYDPAHGVGSCIQKEK